MTVAKQKIMSTAAAAAGVLAAAGVGTVGETAPAPTAKHGTTPFGRLPAVAAGRPAGSDLGMKRRIR
jgi:hypothetical protein